MILSRGWRKNVYPRSNRLPDQLQDLVRDDPESTRRGGSYSRLRLRGVPEPTTVGASMSRKRPRVPGMRSRPAHTLHFARRLADGASLAERLGSSLKTQAEIQPPCVCGSWPEYFQVESWDPEEPKVRRLADGPVAGEVSHAIYVHADSCPVLAAAEREEALVRAAFTPSEGGTDDASSFT